MPRPDPAQIRAVLFDLDGTLLQVDMPTFIPAYLRGLARQFPEQTDPEAFARVARKGIQVLLNDRQGASGNLDKFGRILQQQLGISLPQFRQGVAAYVADGLPALRPLVQPLPLARQLLECCRQRGLRLVLATNPVFPRAVIAARLAWGGMAQVPFEWITALENSRFCKPQSGYFTELLEQLGLAPEQALMVGNDTEHDLAARPLGIPTFLVDTWLIDRCAGNFQTDYRGGHAALLGFLQGLGSARQN